MLQRPAVYPTVPRVWTLAFKPERFSKNRSPLSPRQSIESRTVHLPDRRLSWVVANGRLPTDAILQPVTGAAA